MTDEDRRKLAKQSHNWHCKECDLAIEPDEIKDNQEKDANAENTEIETKNIENNDLDHDDNLETSTNEVVDTEQNENSQELPQTIKDINIENAENENEKSNEKDNEPNLSPNENQEKESENTENHPQIGPYVDEDGISHYNFEELHSVPFESKPSFICVLDIPIIILFFLLLFLIANSAFNFVHFFDFD